MLVDTARQALEQIPGWEGHGKNQAGSSMQRVGSGNTNTSWIVERGVQSYVLRVDSPVAAKLDLDRANEMVVRTHVSAAGLAPGVIYADTQSGILLSEYVPGRAWRPDDVLDQNNLLTLAHTLRRLYALPTVGVAFDPGLALSRYADRIGNEASLCRAREALALLKTIGSRARALCHNDLVASNIIAGERLWLIDWEYAGVGDPLFDLAVVVEHHGVDKELALKFVEASLGSMNRQMAKDLNAYREVYRHLVALWLAIL